MTSPQTQSREIRALVTREKVMEFLKAFGLVQQLSTQEADQFVALAQEFQLNPFKREIHVVPFGEGQYRRLSIVVGYEVYIKRAERTGKLNGWKAWTEGDANQLKAVVEIYRKDWEHPFRHEVYWTEAVQTKKDGSVTSFWGRMPKFQLRKVAISQGFRLAFPDELGGLPYEGAELSIDLDQQSTKPIDQGHVELPSQPEAPIPAPEAPEASGESLSKAVFALDSYLANHSASFTPHHIEWIKDQVEDAQTVEKAQAMLRYAQKVVRTGPNRRTDSRYPQAKNSEPVPIF